MEFERKVVQVGGGTGFTIPNDLLKYLDLQRGDDIIVEDKKDDSGQLYIIVRKDEGDKDVNTQPIKEREIC